MAKEKITTEKSEGMSKRNIIIIIVIVLAVLAWIGKGMEDREIEQQHQKDLIMLEKGEKQIEQLRQTNEIKSIIESGGKIHELRHYNDDGTLDRVEVVYEQKAKPAKPVKEKVKKDKTGGL